MTGFVSVLAGSLAVLIIFFTTVLINVQKVASLKEKAKFLTDNEQLAVGEINFGEDFLVSEKFIVRFKELVKPGKIFKLYCSYGHNLSYQAAERFSVYNYIILKQNDLPVYFVDPLNTGYDELNKCFLFEVTDPVEKEQLLNKK